MDRTNGPLRPQLSRLPAVPFPSSSSARLRTSVNARHTGLVLNAARFHGRNIRPSPSRYVKHANFGLPQKLQDVLTLITLIYAILYKIFQVFTNMKTNIIHLTIS